MREIEAILQKEDLQASEELANADPVADESAEDVEEDAYHVKTAPTMDLCSTAEMMQVFNEMYDDDKLKQDMARSQVNNTSIQARMS